MSSTSYFDRSTIPSRFDLNESAFSNLLESPEQLQLQLLNQHRRMNSSSDGSFENGQVESFSSSTSPSATQEPHTSWRFYTSFDNGEWKRHCVPVFHSEEDILQSNNKLAVATKKYDALNESSLRRMRLGRPALHESIQRRRSANENKAQFPTYNRQYIISQNHNYTTEPIDYKYGYSYGSGTDYDRASDIKLEEIKSKILSSKSKSRDFSEKTIVPSKYKTAEELALENEKAQTIKAQQELLLKNSVMEKNIEIRAKQLPGKDVKVVIVNNTEDEFDRHISKHSEKINENAPVQLAQKAGQDMMKQMEKQAFEQFKEKFPHMDEANAIKEKQELYTETLNVWNGGKAQQETTVCEARFESNNPITGSQNISERIVHSKQDPTAINIYNNSDDNDRLKSSKAIEHINSKRNDSNEKIIIPRKYREVQDHQVMFKSEPIFTSNDNDAMSSIQFNHNNMTLKSNAFNLNNYESDGQIFSRNKLPLQSEINHQTHNMSVNDGIQNVEVIKSNNLFDFHKNASFASDGNEQSNHVSNFSGGDYSNKTTEDLHNFSFNKTQSVGGSSLNNASNRNDYSSSKIVFEENGEKIIIPRKYKQSSENNTLHFNSSDIGGPTSTSTFEKHFSTTDNFKSFPITQHSKQAGSWEF